MSYNKKDGYDIGSVGWESFSLFDPKTWVPTYGKWAGPGWSGGMHTDNAVALQDVLPCYDILKDDDGNYMLSELDDAAKRHDLHYQRHDVSELAADEILVNDTNELLATSGAMDAVETS